MNPPPSSPEQARHRARRWWTAAAILGLATVVGAILDTAGLLPIPEILLYIATLVAVIRAAQFDGWRLGWVDNEIRRGTTTAGSYR